MNNLPDPVGNSFSQTDTSMPQKVNQPPDDKTPMSSSGLGGKEKEMGGIGMQELPMVDLGKEIALPKEVASAGVKIHPTTISLPRPLSQMGLQAAPGTPPPKPVKTVSLPLNDDQIVLGLQQSIASSWRWLAEWCKRRLKQLRIVS